MKIRQLLLALTLLVGCSAFAQWSVGVRDTRYVNVSYTFHKHWSAKLEHSVYSEKFQYQYVRLYMSYKHRIGRFLISGEPYFGMTYKNS